MYCKVNCKHSFLDHAQGVAKSLFTNPLGNYLDPVEKVAHIAFNVLTLGIPLAVYHIYKVASSLIVKAYDKIWSVAPNQYAEFSKKAVAFALDELKKHPDIKPFAFRTGWHGPKDTNQPTNLQIATLTTLFWDVAFKRFEEAIKANKDNPWDNQEVIDAANALIKIGYTISKMTLEDQPAFIRELEAKKNEKRTIAQALTKQDSYQYRTFYYVSRSYHWTRGALGYGVNPRRIDNETAKEELDFLSPEIPEKHAKLFYQAGTIQNEWRTLYNGYCKDVRSLVPENELRRADNRHVTWTKEDNRPSNFHQVPDQLPT